MDFDLSEEQRLLKESVDGLLGSSYDKSKSIFSVSPKINAGNAVAPAVARHSIVIPAKAGIQ